MPELDCITSDQELKNQIARTKEMKHPEYDKILAEYVHLVETQDIPQDLGLEASNSVIAYIIKKYDINRYTLKTWIANEDLPRFQRRSISIGKMEEIKKEFLELQENPVDENGPIPNIMAFLAKKHKVSHAVVANITREFRKAFQRPSHMSRARPKVESDAEFFCKYMDNKTKKRIICDIIMSELGEKVRFIKQSLDGNRIAEFLDRYNNLSTNSRIGQLLEKLARVNSEEKNDKI